MTAFWDILELNSRLYRKKDARRMMYDKAFTSVLNSGEKVILM